MTRYSAPAALFAAGAAAILLAGCEKSATQAAAPPSLPTVTVSRPVVRPVTEWDEFTGRFVATESVDVRARVSGHLTQVHFRDGQIVREGDLLFTIDPRPYQAAVGAAEAQVAVTEAALTLAQQELDRAQRLLRSDTVPQSTLDLRLATSHQREAERLAAQAQLTRAKLDLEFTQIRAPVAGRVDRHNVSAGNLVSGGASDATLLTTIVTLDPIEVSFDVDQNSYLRYTRLAQNGERPSSRDTPNPVVLSLADEPNFVHRGQMQFVSNQLDLSTGTIRVRARFENDALLFTPGLFARVRLIGSAAHEAVLIPDDAIGTDQSRRFVYVVGANDVPEVRPVVTGPLDDGLRVIRSGLEPQERVVVGGIQRVRPGQPVAVQERAVNVAARNAP